MTAMTAMGAATVGSLEDGNPFLMTLGVGSVFALCMWAIRQCLTSVGPRFTLGQVVYGVNVLFFLLGGWCLAIIGAMVLAQSAKVLALLPAAFQEAIPVELLGVLVLSCGVAAVLGLLLVVVGMVDVTGGSGDGDAGQAAKNATATDVSFPQAGTTADDDGTPSESDDTRMLLNILFVGALLHVMMGILLLGATRPEQVKQTFAHVWTSGNATAIQSAVRMSLDCRTEAICRSAVVGLYTPFVSLATLVAMIGAFELVLLINVTTSIADYRATTSVRKDAEKEDTRPLLGRAADGHGDGDGDDGDTGADDGAYPPDGVFRSSVDDGGTADATVHVPSDAMMALTSRHSARGLVRADNNVAWSVL